MAGALRAGVERVLDPPLGAGRVDEPRLLRGVDRVELPLDGVLRVEGVLRAGRAVEPRLLRVAGVERVDVSRLVRVAVPRDEERVAELPRAVPRALRGAERVTPCRAERVVVASLADERPPVVRMVGTVAPVPIPMVRPVVEVRGARASAE